MKLRKSNKSVKLITYVITAATLIVAGFFAISYIRQEDKLLAEIKLTHAAIDARDESKMDEILGRTVGKNEYATVERAIKSYLKDSIGMEPEIYQTMHDEKLDNLLTAAHIATDQDNFETDLKYLDEIDTKENDFRLQYDKVFSADGAAKYLNSDGLNTKYKQIFNDEVATNLEKEKKTNTIGLKLDDLKSMVKLSRIAINLLHDNPNGWSIQDEKIVFSSSTNQKQYTAIAEEIQIIVADQP